MLLKHISSKNIFLKKKIFEFVSFPEKKFKLLPSQSIDKGLMEKTKNGTITITNIKWSDIGSWEGNGTTQLKIKKIIIQIIKILF